MPGDKLLYIGIDIDNDRAIVSYFHEGMSEPVSVSAAAGPANFRIPAAVFAVPVRRAQGKPADARGEEEFSSSTSVKASQSYAYGDEALRRSKKQTGKLYTRLYANAVKEKEGSTYRGLLSRFILRLVKLAYDKAAEGGNLFGEDDFALAIAFPYLYPETVRLSEDIRERCAIAPERFMIMDYGESLFYHTSSQDEGLRLHKTALFDLNSDKLRFILQSENSPGSNFSVCLQDREYPFLADKLSPHEKDEKLCDIINSAFSGHIISAAFLIGGGFDGDWMDKSLKSAGANRRLFKGKNLYSLGAADAIRYKLEENQEYTYICSYKMQADISINVLDNDRERQFVLARAGDNYYEAGKEFVFMYGGTPGIEFYVKSLSDSRAQVKKIELDELPDRPAQTIRLRITLRPLSGKAAEITVSDDGFGELYAPGGKYWRQTWEF